MVWLFNVLHCCSESHYYHFTAISSLMWSVNGLAILAMLWKMLPDCVKGETSRSCKSFFFLMSMLTNCPLRMAAIENEVV